MGDSDEELGLLLALKDVPYKNEAHLPTSPVKSSQNELGSKTKTNKSPKKKPRGSGEEAAVKPKKPKKDKKSKSESDDVRATAKPTDDATPVDVSHLS